MCGRRFSVEQAGLRQLKRTSADRHRHVCRRRYFSQPFPQRFGALLGGDDDDLAFGCVRECVIGNQLQPAGAFDRTGFLRDREELERHLIADHRVLKYFPRASEVDYRHAL